MNYYPHHIGDFNNATRHLSRVERSLYRDMIDMYYDTEQPLTADFKLLCRKLMARTEEEVTGVEQVLNEFFTQAEQGWVHARCEQVIAEYREQSEKKSAAGKASAEARAAAKASAQTKAAQGSATGVEQVLDTRSTNQEPITNNQEPETKEKTNTPAAPKYSALDDLVSHGVDRQIASDWLAVRKSKKAAPTRTAIDGVLRELGKAGISPADGIRLCTERAWAGFSPEWLQPKGPQARASPSGAGQMSKAGQVTAANAMKWLEEQDAS
jgi:uncharacterized protein YdaU (DUF1376 family)